MLNVPDTFLNLPEGEVMLVSHPVTSMSTWYFLNGSNVDEFNKHSQKVIEVEGAVLGTQNFFGLSMVYDIVSVM